MNVSDWLRYEKALSHTSMIINNRGEMDFLYIFYFHCMILRLVVFFDYSSDNYVKFNTKIDFLLS